MVDQPYGMKSIVPLAAIEWLIVLTYLAPFAGMATTVFDLYVCVGIPVALMLLGGLHILFTTVKPSKSGLIISVGFILVATMAGTLTLHMNIFWLTGMLFFGLIYLNRLWLFQTNEDIGMVSRRLFAFECVLFPLFMMLCSNVSAKTAILPHGITLIAAAIFVGSRLFSLSYIQQITSGSRTGFAQTMGIGSGIGIMVLWMGIWKVFQAIVSRISTPMSTGVGKIPKFRLPSGSKTPPSTYGSLPLKPIHPHAVSAPIHIEVPAWLWLAIGLLVIGAVWLRLKTQSKALNDIEQVVVSTERRAIRKSEGFRLLSTDSPVRRLYQEFLQRMASSGFPIQRAETPRSYAYRLQVTGNADDELWKTNVQKITEAYELVRYNDEHVDNVWEQKIAADLSNVKLRSPHLP